MIYPLIYHKIIFSRYIRSCSAIYQLTDAEARFYVGRVSGICQIVNFFLVTVMLQGINTSDKSFIYADILKYPAK